jgi:hypothetical protein
LVACCLLYLAALYQKILEMCEGIGQGGAAGRGNGNGSGGGGFGRSGGGNNSDEGIASKGEGLLDLLGELDITQQSYSQYLQALLMDVRRWARA